jgi:hypothetical protein
MPEEVEGPKAKLIVYLPRGGCGRPPSPITWRYPSDNESQIAWDLNRSSAT